MPLVEIPGHDSVEFPDTMTGDEISAAIQKNFPDLQKQSEPGISVTGPVVTLDKPVDVPLEKDSQIAQLVEQSNPIKKAWDAINYPIINFVPSWVKKFGAIEAPATMANAAVSLFEHPTKGQRYAQGAAQGVTNLAEGFTSGLGIATLGMGALPRMVQRAISIGFAAQLFSQVPEVAKQLDTEFAKPEDQRDEKKIGALITQGIGALGMGTMAGVHGITPESSFAPKTLEAVKTLTGKETPDASNKPSAASVLEPEVRPPVGESTPLRQQGETPGAQPPVNEPSQEIVPQEEPAAEGILTKEEQIQAQKDLQNELTGMGGAVPSEFELSAQTPTSIKNATVEQERLSRGLPPAVQPARRSFGAVWDQAMAKIDQQPDYPDRLIDELRDKPRALTDAEDATLLYRQIDLQNEYAKTTRELAQAYDDGRMDAVEELKVRTAGWSDKLLDLYNINKMVGTETGRGLAARRMMAYEDFSLAKMEIDKRAAKGGTPLTPKDQAELVAANQKITELQKRVDEYEGKTAAPDIDEIITKTKASPKISKVTDIAGLKSKIGERLKEGDLQEGGTLIQKLARHFVSENLKITRSELVDKVHGVLKEFLPDITPRETMDAISGYGDFKQLTKDEVSVTLRDLKGQMQQIGKLEDMAKGQAPQKTGVERRSPSDEERRLIKQVEEAKRQGGYKVTDPARQLRTALEAVKTRLTNQIKDLELQISTRQKIVKNKTALQYDAEASRLKLQRGELKKQYDSIFPKEPMTDAQRLEMWKKRTQTRIEELNTRLASGDFSKRTMRPPPALDEQASRLKVDLDRAKQSWQRALIEDRLKNRDWWVKAQDTFTRWYRGGILSSPVVFAKLTAAALTRMTLTPMEEAVGAGISKALPKLAARAPREGFWNSKAEAKSITDSLMKGPKDAWDVLRTGETDLDVLYGKGREGAIGESQVRPFSISDIPGRSHGAFKAPVKRAEFARSLEKRLAWEVRNGADASNPAVQLRASVEAYKDANRAIFLQDNRVVSAYRRGLKAFEENEKVTGKPTVGGTVAATVLKTFLPVVRVPSNIVAETFQYSIGSVTGSARLARAMSKGIETLPPEQADLIMRELKKGSIGAAALIAGFLLPEVWGGYYQQGEKRKPKDIKPGYARINGEDIPPSLMHSPLFETIQAGATIRRVADTKYKKSDPETQGVGVGIMAGSLGLTEEVPFVREMVDTAKAFDPRQREAYFGELSKSISVPQLLQWMAKQQDQDVTGETTQRKATNFVQHIEMGIPGLRKNVPVKKGAPKPEPATK